MRLKNLLVLAPKAASRNTCRATSDEHLRCVDEVPKGTHSAHRDGGEYGSGSSRDWAAKGTLLLGVKAVIAESYERIHRSNLVGMGVLPLQFVISDGLIAERAKAQRLREAGHQVPPDPSVAEFLKLTGEEVYDIDGLKEGLAKNFDAATRELTVTAKKPDGTEVVFKAICRIDTPQEVEYYKNGGILPYVLRKLKVSPLLAV